MVFKCCDDLPIHIKKALKKKSLQEMYIHKFNEAFDDYQNDILAHRIAWGVMETKYPKERRRSMV